MTKKKQTAEFSNLAVIEFPLINTASAKNKTKPNEELHLIQIDDGYKPKSIFVNRSWNKDLKTKP